MHTTIPLPRTLEQLTPEWLSAALRKPVADVEVEQVLWGTATKVLVRVRHPDTQVQERLCIKGEFDERSRAALAGMTMTGTQVEALFFNDLAPSLGVPLPRHLYAGSEPGMGILVLENLAAQGFAFGTPTQPWSADRVASALDILAALHGSTWGRRYPHLEWLAVGSKAVRQAGEMLMSDAHWARQFAQPGVYRPPQALFDNQRLLRAYREMWTYDDRHADCVIHGDAHLGNTCISPDGQPFFIDWAGPCHSHWGIDVPYFVVGALAVADRRAVERDLLSHYLERLAAHGGPRLDAGQAWDDYRRHLVHGMMWATLPAALQSSENVHAMGERYAEAMVEHDALSRLGV